MNNTSDHHGVSASALYGKTFLYPVAACYILIAVVAAVGNSLVCFAILVNKSLRNNPTNLFLLSLAVSDLLTATLAMPFDIEALFLYSVWRHGKIMCVTFLTVYLITVPTSILTLLAVSVDRYKSLSDPLARFRREQFMTKRKALIVISVLWLYCIIWALLPLMGWPFRIRGRPVITYQGICTVPFSKLYTTLVNFLTFLVPLIITCVFYIMIYFIALKHHRSASSFRNSGPPARQPSKEEAKYYVKNLKAAKTTSMFVAAIFFCWQPFTYFSIIANLYGHENWKNYPWELFCLLLMLGYLNSALNPFLFAFRNKHFKVTYVRMLSSIRRSNSRVSARRRSTVSLSTTFSSDIPETENKDVRLQSVRHKRTTPDPPRRHSTPEEQA